MSRKEDEAVEIALAPPFSLPASSGASQDAPGVATRPNELPAAGFGVGHRRFDVSVRVPGPGHSLPFSVADGRPGASATK